jgi:hypothetical protein
MPLLQMVLLGFGIDTNIRQICSKWFCSASALIPTFAKSTPSC